MGGSLLRSWIDSLWSKILSIFLFQKELSIAIIGLQNSGKTTLTHMLGGRPFEQDTVPTLGIQVSQFSLENSFIKVYDLGGQTRFQSLWERCFSKVDLIIYMIDLSDTMTLDESFEKLSKVMQMTQEDRIPMLVIGNKIDLIQEPKEKQTIATIPTYNYDSSERLRIDSTNAHLLKNADVLTRQVGVDLKNRQLHIPLRSSESQGIDVLPLNRDIAVFTMSCRNGLCISNVIDWIVQL